MNILDIIIIFLGILFKYLLECSVSSVILYIVIFAICLLTIIDLYYLKLTKKEFLYIFSFFCISLFFLLTKKEVNFLISFLFALILIRKNEESYVKTFLLCSLIFFCMTILLNIFGILESSNIIRYKYGEKTIRYSLGFGHPNLVFLFFLPIALCGYYLYGEKKWYYVLLISSSLILYAFCDSRTGLLCIFSIIFFHLFLNKKILNNKFFRIFIDNFIIILTIGTFLLCLLFGHSLSNRVSALLSGRPYYLKSYLDKGMVFSLFGHSDISGYVIDNFYLFILIELGIFGFFVYFFIYKNGIKKSLYSKKYILIYLVFCIYGLAETNMIIGSINFLFPILIKNIIERK